MTQLELFNKFKLSIINDPCMTGKWLTDQFIVDSICNDDDFIGTTKRSFNTMVSKLCPLHNDKYDYLALSDSSISWTLFCNTRRIDKKSTSFYYIKLNHQDDPMMSQMTRKKIEAIYNDYKNK